MKRDQLFEIVRFAIVGGASFLVEMYKSINESMDDETVVV